MLLSSGTYPHSTRVFRQLVVQLLLILVVACSPDAVEPDARIEATAAVTTRAVSTASVPGAGPLVLGVPSGTAQNDVLVAFIATNGGGSASPPSGWQAI